MTLKLKEVYSNSQNKIDSSWKQPAVRDHLGQIWRDLQANPEYLGSRLRGNDLYFYKFGLNDRKIVVNNTTHMVRTDELAAIVDRALALLGKNPTAASSASAPAHASGRSVPSSSRLRPARRPSVDLTNAHNGFNDHLSNLNTRIGDFSDRLSRLEALLQIMLGRGPHNDRSGGSPLNPDRPDRSPNIPTASSPRVIMPDMLDGMRTDLNRHLNRLGDQVEQLSIDVRNLKPARNDENRESFFTPSSSPVSDPEDDPSIQDYTGYVPPNPRRVPSRDNRAATDQSDEILRLQGELAHAKSELHAGMKMFNANLNEAHQINNANTKNYQDELNRLKCLLAEARRVKGLAEEPLVNGNRIDSSSEARDDEHRFTGASNSRRSSINSSHSSEHSEDEVSPIVYSLGITPKPTIPENKNNSDKYDFTGGSSNDFPPVGSRRSSINSSSESENDYDNLQNRLSILQGNDIVPASQPKNPKPSRSSNQSGDQVVAVSKKPPSFDHAGELRELRGFEGVLNGTSPQATPSLKNLERRLRVLNGTSPQEMLDRQKEVFEHEANILKAQLEGAEEEIAIQNQSIAELSRQVEDLQLDLLMESWRRQLADPEDSQVVESKALQDQLSQAKSKHQRATQKVSEMTKAMAAMAKRHNEEMTALQNKLAEQEQKVNALQDDLNNTKALQKTALSQKAQLEQQLNEAREALEQEKEKNGTGIARLETENASLQSKIDASTAEMDQAKQREALVRKELEELINTRESKAAEMDAQLSALKTANEELRSLNADLVGKNEELVAAKENVELQNQTLVARISKSQKSIDQLNQDLNAARNGQELHEQEMASLKRELDSGLKKLRNSEAALASQSEKLSANSSALQAANGEIQRLTNDLEKKDSEKEAIEIKLQIAHRQVAELTSKNDALSISIAQLQADKIALQNQNQALSSQLSEAQQTVETLESQLTAKQSELDALNQAHTELNSELGQLREQNADLVSKNEALVANEAQLQAEKTDIQAQNQALSSQLSEAQRNVDDLKSQLASLTESHTQIIQRNSELNGAVQKDQQQIAELKDKLAAAERSKQEISDLIESQNKREIELNSQLKKLKDENARQREILAATEATRQTAQQTIDHLRDKLNSRSHTSEEVEQIQAQLREAQDQVQQLTLDKDRFTAMESRVSELQEQVKAAKQEADDYIKVNFDRLIERGKLEAQNEMNAQLEAQRVEYDAKIGELESSIRTLSEENEAKRSALVELEKASQEAESIQERIGALEHEKLTLGARIEKFQLDMNRKEQQTQQHEDEMESLLTQQKGLRDELYLLNGRLHKANEKLENKITSLQNELQREKAENQQLNQDVQRGISSQRTQRNLIARLQDDLKSSERQIEDLTESLASVRLNNEQLLNGDIRNDESDTYSQADFDDREDLDDIILIGRHKRANSYPY